MVLHFGGTFRARGVEYVCAVDVLCASVCGAAWCPAGSSSCVAAATAAAVDVVV